MNQELLEKLKKAGFTISNIGWDDTWEENLKAPTLSELIEACGEKLKSLSRYEKRWMAYSDEDDGHGNNLETIQNTPEEAVATLWLGLNGSEEK